MQQDTTWLVNLARQAAAAILDVYNSDFDVNVKADNSPVTRADLAAHRIIAEGLAAQDPDTPLISEEEKYPDFSVRRQWQRYWLVDPLDGTKEFVNRNDEFTVNIALIEGHRPVLGIVHVPVTNTTYIGQHNVGATRQVGDAPAASIEVSRQAPKKVRVVGSRSHMDTGVGRWLKGIGDFDLVRLGSSLKFCVVAEGGADFYPRLGPTCEWDTAAAQAVVEAAGGRCMTLDGETLAYNTKADMLNPDFIVIGNDSRDWLSMAPAATVR